MAPASTPKSGRGLQARLTAKVGPLPVWAWAAVILVAYLLFSRMRPPAATTSADTSSASTEDGTTGSAQVPASGQGSPASNMNGDLLAAVGQNTASIDALTSQVLNASAHTSDYGSAPAAGIGYYSDGYGDYGGSVSAPAPSAPPASAPTTPPVTAVQAGGSAAHQTQAAAGSLAWGGLTFTTKAAFDRWAKAHGTSAGAEFKTHPQARAIYGTLA